MDLNEYMKITGKVVGKNKVAIGNDIEVERMKLASPSFNYLLGGGVPEGTVIEIYGESQCGKSLFALTMASEIQRITGKYVAYVQAGEVGYTTTHAENLGLNIEGVLTVNPTTAEEALTVVRDLLTPDFCVVILDSVGGLVPGKLSDESKEIGEVSTMGTRARLLSDAMPQFSIKCTENKTILILINQIRNVNLSGYGSPEGTMGGKSVPYWSSIRIQATKKASKAEDSDGLDFFEVHLKITKSKYGKSLRRVDMVIDTIEEAGIVKTSYNKYLDVIRMAKHFNVINQSGAWITLSLPDYKSGEVQKINGETKLEAELIANPELFESLRDQLNKLS